MQTNTLHAQSALVAGISVGTATMTGHKSPWIRWLQVNHRVAEQCGHAACASTRSRAAAEPLPPFLLSHPSRFLFFLFPEGYACQQRTGSGMLHQNTHGVGT